MLQVVSSQSPDVRDALPGSQMMILMRRLRVWSAGLASTQRTGTMAPALAVLVVASHQRLAEQVRMHVGSASRDSTVSQAPVRASRVQLVVQTTIPMLPRRVRTVKQERTLDAVRHRAMSASLVRLTAMRMLPRHARHAYLASTG